MTSFFIFDGTMRVDSRPVRYVSAIWPKIAIIYQVTALILYLTSISKNYVIKLKRFSKCENL